MKRDWRNPEDYTFTQKLSPELWAWQFLRRNPEYQKDYDWFIQTWRALEADYGSAPNRDFSRWKLDFRAYAPDEMTRGFCEDDKSCASPDGDKILIECAMGAKWGFYKFPNSPAIEFPEIPEQLVWREIDFIVSEPDGPTQLYEADLRFDLRLSLNEQLSVAKRQLVIQKRQRRVELLKTDVLSIYLRMIDAGDTSDQDIANLLYEGDLVKLTHDRQRADEICRTDYRLFLMLSR